VWFSHNKLWIILSESCFNCKKTPNLIKKTVSLLCVKTKNGVHKQLTFYFQMRKYFCRHLHSSLISMDLPVCARPWLPAVPARHLAQDNCHECSRSDCEIRRLSISWNSSKFVKVRLHGQNLMQKRKRHLEKLCLIRHPGQWDDK